MPKSLPDQIADESGYLEKQAYVLTRNRDTAQDLAQDAILRALENHHLYVEGNLKGWLFQILRNVHIDNLRRDKKHAALTDLPDFIADAGSINNSVTNEAIASLTEADIQQAISGLSETIQPTARLRMYGYKYEEIAAILGIPSTCVRNHLHQARLKLPDASCF